MGELHLTKFAQVRPLGTSFRYGGDHRKVKSKLSYLSPQQNMSSEFQVKSNQNKASNFGSRQVLQNEGHSSESEKFVRNKSVKKRSKSQDSKDESPGAYKSSKLPISGSAMQTLDRRISASSDQLDTLKKITNREKPLRTRSSSRISFERKFNIEESENKEAKPFFNRKNGSKRSRDGSKTPFEMFLENDGPYSRKLYGPVTPKTPRNIKRFDERQSVINKAQTRKEKIVYTTFMGQNIVEKDKEDVVCPKPINKGLLWQQKDKFFSRWKERFFILTEDYLQCFRKENSRISEMGTFLFKLKLSDVEEVSLLTKKGYLTISVNHIKDGRVFLRRHEGIKEWFSMIKANVVESKANRLRHDKGQNNLSVEAWLLARQNMAATGTPLANKDPHFNKSVESSVKTSYDTENAVRNDLKNIPGNHPRGINRLSMVADLLQSETIATLAHKNSDKQGDDSGLESGHTSMNNASDSQSDGGEEPPSSHQTSTPDIIRTSHQARGSRCDSFSIQTSQRRHYSRYNNLPVTIV